jgi:regulatory protein
MAQLVFFRRVDLMKRITALRSTGGRQKRVSLYLDGRLVLRLDAEVVVKEGLAVGQELSPEQVADLTKQNLYHRCLAAAVHYLSYRPRSVSEIRSQLRRRGFFDHDIEAVLARLTEQGLVDDASFARFWRDNREQFSPRSRLMTGLELRRRGVPSAIIEEALSSISDEDIAYRAAGARARKLSLTDYHDFYRRLGGYLKRRGFGYGIINHTVERLWRELGGKSSSDSLFMVVRNK